MNEENWTNLLSNDCQTSKAPTIDDLYALVKQLKENPVPARFEAGGRMYAFLRDCLAEAEGSRPFPVGIPVILSADMPSELAHLYDTNNQMINSFIWREGEDGPKVLIFTHPKPGLPEYWMKHDLQRVSETPTGERSEVRNRMEPPAPRLADHPNDGSRPLQVWLDARGLGPQDGSEPSQDQES
jgi:hypothetical protein